MASDEIYTVETFPYEIISGAPVQKRRPGNQGTRERKVYNDLICAFDIETTMLPDIQQSFMYVWQAQIGPEFTIIGRTWEEFKTFRSNVFQQLKKNEWLVIWIHNLSFEFQFLSDPDIYDFDTKEVFCMDSRKILKAEMSQYRLEFRCSYLHTNMSLDEFTKKMGVPDYKQSGDKFDYSKIRYPWTPLNEMEMRYIINDVKGLVEALIVEIKHDQKNLYNIPRTSTGYVREDIKKAMRTGFNRNTLRYMQPDLHILELLRMAFRGGNTHANRYFSDIRIEGPVHSVDLSSSYPAVQLTREFPMTPFREIHDHSVDFILELLNVRHQALLLKVAFSFIRLRDERWPVPYISKSKCHNLFNGSFDNGRVLAAEYLETVITDVDLRIILEEYEFDEMIVIEAWASRYGYLPQAIRDVTIGYYKAKTELKGVKGQELYYMKAKNKLNSIYGQSVQLPVKPTIEYVNGLFLEKEEDDQKKLDSYIHRAHQVYQWGVWITAHARMALEEGIRLAYEQGYFLYCDTDSVKYKGDVDFSKYNKKQEKIARKMGAWAADPYGEVHFMGVYEDEGIYTEFKTLGAKKYAYRTEDGKLHITISGVNKTKGAEELEAAGGLDALEDGFVFRNSGKTEVKYYDTDTAYGDYQVGDKMIHIGKNVTILDTTYTVGLTDEYKTLLSDPTIWKRLFTDL